MIKHIKCDIFESGADIICHQVNCQGQMNSGIAKQVKDRFPWVYNNYKELCDKEFRNPSNLLGFVQPAALTNGIDDSDNQTIIMNLFAQENFGYDGKCYTDYDSLKKCLEMVRLVCEKETKIAIPYLMGCHRGGGDWNIVYKMIEEIFANSDCEVLICEYNGG